MNISFDPRRSDEARGHAVNPAAIFNQIDRMGVSAIPVVVLMSAIVCNRCPTGAYQLSYFGADISSSTWSAC
jgi:phospholipid/cholesterol/gamma-HCH transport system permease protein